MQIRRNSGWLLAVAGLHSVAFAISATLLAGGAQAKLPGAVHCYNDICHRVRTVAETEARRGIEEPLVASFYDSPEKDRFNPSLETSSGTQFEPYADDNAASPIHPDGTILLLWSPVTRGAVVVRVNNAGPYYPGRTLDVSRGVAERLGFSRGGTMQLLSVVIGAPSEPEAHYVRGRVYPKVRGYLGKFDNIALASLAEPIARRATAPRVDTNAAMSPSAQIALHVTEEHFRLTELALAFQAAPAEVISPDEGVPDGVAVAAIMMIDRIGEVAAVMIEPEVMPAQEDSEPVVGMPWQGRQRSAEATTATAEATSATQDVPTPNQP